jgi:hypothetical protein
MVERGASPGPATCNRSGSSTTRCASSVTARPGPTWLTLLGPGLAADLGLTDPSTVVGPTATTVGNGLCLRAAIYPPLGLDRADVGTLPTIARLLRPRRLDRPAEHYARFDELPDGPYQNRPPRGW